MNKIVSIILVLAFILVGCSKKQETGFKGGYGNMVDLNKEPVYPAVVKVGETESSAYQNDADWKELEKAPTKLDVRNLAKCLGRTRDTRIVFTISNNGKYVFETGEEGTLLVKFLHCHANRSRTPGPRSVWDEVSRIEIDSTTGKVLRWGAWGDHRMPAYSVDEFDDLQSRALAMCDL